MNILPSPEIQIEKEGVIAYSDTIKVFCDSKFSKVANKIKKIFLDAAIDFSFEKREAKCDVQILCRDSFGTEEYEIDCVENTVIIKASTQNGALYAIESFRQLASLDFHKNGENLVFPSVYILDKPSQFYRGLHFDVARHFYTKEEIFSILDHMARMKLNFFHFHLTDDQGFRIPLQKHPQISEVGKTRYGTEIKRIGRVVDDKEYSYIYTLEDLHEIVSYADSLGIEVIPEIDLPGHMVAVISAYNELSCTGLPIEVRKKWGVSKDLLCAGNSKIYDVVCDILDEVCEVFPSKYFHIGGDEAPKERWKECPKCQAVMKEKNLRTEEDLQGDVFNYFCKYLKEKNKIVIGWNDCLNDTLDEAVIVEHWTSNPNGRDYINTLLHVNKGRKAIISGVPYYFDHPYAKVSLQDTYNYSIYLDGIHSQAYENILGSECCVWTEWMPKKEKMHFNLFPRLAVFAECAWVKNKLNYKDFIVKLKSYYKVYEKFDIYYARGMEHKKPHTLLNKFLDILTQRLKKFYREVNRQLKNDGKALLP